MPTIENSQKEKFLDDFQRRCGNHRLSDSVARRLYEPLRGLHAALSSCDLRHVKRLGSLTLAEAAAVYGASQGLRFEFSVEGGDLVSSLPVNKI